MNGDEIIKALNRMAEEDPEGFSSEVLDFINHKNAEIKMLKSDVATLTDANNNLVELCKKEKEKAEKLKGKMINLCKRMKEGDAK